jgi:chemotaxis family two-component system response regulator PixH
MKIFICEQDVSKAKSIQAILGMNSYKVVTVEKYSELFRNISNQKPAVIIINKSFSKNSGLDVVNKLKTDPTTSRIPIIYIGDQASDEQMPYVSNESLIEYLEEPVRIKNLRHYVDRWTTFRSIHIKH